MKKFNLFIMAMTFTTFASAQDYFQCNFMIKDNEVNCPLIGRCPQKELKESSTSIGFEINDGEIQSGEILTKRVILNAGTKKQDKSLIYLFADDKRDEKLKEKDVDLVSIDLNAGIQYEVTRIGDVISFRFDSSTSQDQFDGKLMGGSGVYLNSFIFTKTNNLLFSGESSQAAFPIIFKCTKENSAAISDSKRQKEIIDNHLKNKVKSSSSAQ